MPDRSAYSASNAKSVRPRLSPAQQDSSRAAAADSMASKISERAEDIANNPSGINFEMPKIGNPFAQVPAMVRSAGKKIKAFMDYNPYRHKGS